MIFILVIFNKGLIKMKTFFVNVIDNKTPLNKDDLFAWAKLNQITNHTNSTQVVCDYLESLGFIKGEHKISEETFAILKMVAGLYLDTWLPDYTVFNIDELLVDGGNFWFRNNDSRVKPTDKLINLLSDRGLVYSLEPRNYYFEVINNYLFIKYQHIIGSRRICLIANGDNHA